MYSRGLRLSPSLEKLGLSIFIFRSICAVTFSKDATVEQWTWQAAQRCRALRILVRLVQLGELAQDRVDLHPKAADAILSSMMRRVRRGLHPRCKQKPVIKTEE
jgi:hypothetical protein